MSIVEVTYRYPPTRWRCPSCAAVADMAFLYPLSRKGETGAQIFQCSACCSGAILYPWERLTTYTDRNPTHDDLPFICLPYSLPAKYMPASVVVLNAHG